jgi:hypothetical protein
LQKINNNKMTYRNESLQGGQRVVDVKADGEFKTHSPIALDLNGSGSIETTGSSTAKVRAAGSTLGQTVKFDLNGDGKQENIEWMAGSGDGLLVDDRDGKAASSMTGNRLFGDQNGQFNSGYEQLSLLDANLDGQLAGTELSGLKVWVDNGDAKVASGEMKSLADVGVTQIAVNQHDVVNANGETLMQSTAQQNGQSLVRPSVSSSISAKQKRSGLTIGVSSDQLASCYCSRIVPSAYRRRTIANAKSPRAPAKLRSAVARR